MVLFKEHIVVLGDDGAMRLPDDIMGDLCRFIPELPEIDFEIMFETVRGHPGMVLIRGMPVISRELHCCLVLEQSVRPHVSRVSCPLV
jgi:hypothetical protein